MQLGDLHNFGKCVCLVDDKTIHKPRCVFWEYCILSVASDFRRTLLAVTKGVFANSFLLPDLNVTSKNINDGSVEVIRTAQLQSGVLNKQDVKNIGATIGLLCWLGVSDLHYQNIIFGRDELGQLIFAPIDIEGLFHDFVLPSQTLLLPSENCKKFGLKELHTLFQEDKYAKNNILYLCQGFVESLFFLEKYGKYLENSICHTIGEQKIPIRLFIRSTSDYKMAGENKFVPPILTEELEQLSRGDIPYFFRFFHDANIYYFKTPSSYTEVHVDPELKKQILNSSRIPINGLLPLKNVNLLIKGGVLQLLKVFLGTWIGTLKDDDVEIISNTDFISMNYKNRLRIKCQR